MGKKALLREYHIMERWTWMLIEMLMQLIYSLLSQRAPVRFHLTAEGGLNLGAFLSYM